MRKVFSIIVFTTLVALILGITLFKSLIAQENKLLIEKLVPKIEALFDDSQVDDAQRKNRLANDIFNVLKSKNSMDHFAVYSLDKSLIFYWSRHNSTNPQIDFFTSAAFQSMVNTYSNENWILYTRIDLISLELIIYIVLGLTLLCLIAFLFDKKKTKPDSSITINNQETIIHKSIEENFNPEQFSTKIKNELSHIEQKKYKRTEGLIDRFTGVCRGDILEYRLEKELARSAENNVDLSLLLVRFKGLKNSKKTNAAQVMIDEFTHEDLIFEHGDDAFFVILPQSDFDQSLAKTELFIARRDFNLLNGVDEKVVTLMAGISSRNGRLMSSKRLINEVEIAIKKARDQDGKIVGFRPDPMKFRHYLSHTKV